MKVCNIPYYGLKSYSFFNVPRKHNMKWLPLQIIICSLLLFKCAEVFDTSASDAAGPLSNVTLIYPEDNLIYASGFSLKWRKEPSDHFFAYKLCIETQPGITEHCTPYHTTFIQNDTSLVVTALEPGTTYYGKLFVCSSTYWKESKEFSVTTKICTTGVFTGNIIDGMVLIPAGSYRDESGNVVDIGHAFYMDMTEVTEASWDSLMTGRLHQSQRPKTGASWYEILLFCNTKSIDKSLDTCYSYSNIEYNGLTISGLTDLHCDFTVNGFRLPTEDEWEYAYRAGVPTDYFWGKNFGTQKIGDSIVGFYPGTVDDTLEMCSFAWCIFDSVDTAQSVGQKAPNPWKLYDIAGNVDELVWDWFALRPEVNRINYHGPETGTWKIRRGGTWNKGPYELAVMYRGLCKPDIADQYTGFRMVRTKPDYNR